MLHRFAGTAVLALVLSGFSSVLAQAPPQPHQGPPIIRSIEVQYVGPQTVSKERVLSQMRTKVGQPYSDIIVEQDIRSLYQTGQVQNVRIFGSAAENGVKVTVVVQTRAVVNELEIEGNTKLSAKTLRKKISLKLNQPLSEEELEKARQSIIDSYKARGYNDIDVKYRVDADEARGTSRVVYTINEGTKDSISQIRFEGNTHFTQTELRKEMKTRGKTMLAFIDKSGRLDEAQLQQDLNAVREFYQNHGYIDAEVQELQRERTGGKMVIVVGITEGPQYHVGKISITGAKATTPDKIYHLLKMKEGDIYSPKAVHDDAKSIADAYGTGGYVDLEVRPEGTPAKGGFINVHYQINEGDRSFVQRVNIIGNTRTKDKVLRREVLVAPGDVYNTVRVETSRKRLDNLGYFAKVETYPEETGVAGRKDLTIQVEEKRTGSFNFGAGYSTIDSIVGFAELSQGNFDILNWPSFTGGGQKFRVRVQLGSERKDLILALTEPYFLDRRLSLGGQAFYQEANYYSSIYNQRNYGMSLELRKPIGAFVAVSLGYRLEDIEIYDVSSGASQAIADEEGTRLKSQITPGIVFDTRDNPFLTRTGQRITFTPYIAGGFLGGNEQMYGFDIAASQYFHLPKDLILLLNGEVAGVDTWGNGDHVHIFDRLFLGGSNDLRGFAFRDVGPRDEHGEPLGGESMARATVELTMPVVEKVRLAVFYDVGFVNAASWDYSADSWASDVGVGLRLDLPIGPLRVDYGYPIQRDGRGSGGHFNFNVGYQF
ncbi:MAG: outer membrane protein assembly factor BamA [Chthoniobacterales bacterium]